MSVTNAIESKKGSTAAPSAEMRPKAESERGTLSDEHNLKRNGIGGLEMENSYHLSAEQYGWRAIRRKGKFDGLSTLAQHINPHD
jgi:hypothetical protein